MSRGGVEDVCEDRNNTQSQLAVEFNESREAGHEWAKGEPFPLQ